MASGSKMGKKNFYAVAVGRKPGIYQTWSECEAKVKGFSGAKFKGFGTKHEAESYMTSLGVSTIKQQPPPNHTKPLPSIQPSQPSVKVEAQPDGSTKKRRPTIPIENVKKTNDVTIKQEPQEPTTKRQKMVDGGNVTGISFEVSFDGGSRGNPGLAGCGAEVITRITTTTSKAAGTHKETSRTKTHIRRLLTGPPYRHTNNQAEYGGILCGLDHVYKVLSGLLDSLQPPLPHMTLEVQGDSKLVIEQLRGNYKCNRNTAIWDYCVYTKSCLEKLRDLSPILNVKLSHVYRSSNTIADGLANQAMDAKASWITEVDPEGNDTRREVAHLDMKALQQRPHPSGGFLLE